MNCRIPAVTLWGLSTDNLKQRALEEVEKICETVSEGLATFCREQATANNQRRIKAVVQLQLLPEALRHQIAEAEHLTASSGPWQLNIAVAYDG